MATKQIIRVILFVLAFFPVCALCQEVKSRSALDSAYRAPLKLRGYRISGSEPNDTLVRTVKIIFIDSLFTNVIGDYGPDYLLLATIDGDRAVNGTTRFVLAANKSEVRKVQMGSKQNIRFVSITLPNTESSNYHYRLAEYSFESVLKESEFYSYSLLKIW